MKLIQYRGPFAAGDTFEAPATTGLRYVHIGLQAPFREPLRQIVNSALPADFEITDSRGVASRFRVNDTDILEFDGLESGTLTIKALRDLPFGSTIDIVYKEQEI